MTGPDEHPDETAGVLSSLPATRPQRRSPKRAAAKTSAGSGPTPPRGGPPAAGEPPPTPAAADPVRATPPLAAQGFEAEPIEGTVNPPTGVELLGAVGHAATELAEIGIALTRRLARTVLDRLPRL